jgi:hypothetical protein
MLSCENTCQIIKHKNTITKETDCWDAILRSLFSDRS